MKKLIVLSFWSIIFNYPVSADTTDQKWMNKSSLPKLVCTALMMQIALIDIADIPSKAEVKLVICSSSILVMLLIRNLGLIQQLMI